MKKAKILTACILGAMLLIGSSLHSEAADVDRNKSMREVKSTKYTDDNGVEKTILWVDNITPPVMNGSNDGNADFKKIETTQGGNRYIEYVAPYKVGNGWYDINKTFDQDTFLCFSATASNMLHWWMDQNRGYIDDYLNGNPDIPKAQEIKKMQQSPTGQHGSNIYDKFVEEFANRKEGYWPDILQDQFINGYRPKENGGTNDPEWDGKDLIQNGPVERGGFFYNVFGPDILTTRREYGNGSYAAISDALKWLINQGKIVSLTYDMRASAHVVTLWGIELDPSGNVCAVYYSDSDDTDNASEGMRRYRLINRNGTAYVTTDTKDDGSGSMVTCLTALSTGKDVWEKVTGQSKIEVELTWENTEFVYNGKQQKPTVKTWNIIEGDDAQLLPEGEGVVVGTYTAIAKIIGADANKYVLPPEHTQQFVIKKSGTVFDGGIKTYVGSTESLFFDIGDTITVKVSPRATGKKSSEQAQPLSPAVLPTNGKMVLYCGSQQVSGPVPIDGKGSYQLNCQILADQFPEGENKLTAKFFGDDNLEDFEQTITIRVAGDGYLAVDEIPPSCETPGEKGHFVDKDGKLYIEENGQKKEVTKEQLVIPATGHRPKGTWVQIGDRHYKECLNGCGSHLDEAACSGGVATTTERAICSVCGNPYGELLETPEKPDRPEEKYEILSGDGNKYITDSKEDLVFKANGDFTKFTGIRVDGVSVDARYYTATSGSTIVTLKNEYLATLSVGKHTLEITYTDGAAVCSFEVTRSSVPSEGNAGGESSEPPKSVEEKPTKKAAKTSDDTASLLWMLLLLGAGTVMTVVRGKVKIEK